MVVIVVFVVLQLDVWMMAAWQAVAFLFFDCVGGS